MLRRHLAVLERRIGEAKAAKELLEECPHARQEIAARIPPP